MQKKHLSVSLALLALLSLGTACASSGGRKELTKEEKIDLYETTATYLYDDGALIRAQDQAVKVLELDPKNQSMRRMVGWIRLRLGSPEDVIIADQFFTKLRDEGDEHEATTLGLAIAKERLGTAYQGTAKEYADGTRNPMDVSDPAARAKELERTAIEYWTESVQLYESTLKDGEGSTRSKNGLQRVYALLGEYETSLHWSQEVLTDAELELAAWRRMLTGGDLTEEEEERMRNNEAGATTLLTDTHLFAATLLNRLGRFAEASRHLDAVVDLDPGIPQVYSRRAQLRAMTGDWDLAIADIDHFLRLANDLPYGHPDVRRAFDLRADCENRLSQGDE